MKKVKDFLFDLFPPKLWLILICINLVGFFACAFCDSAYADSYSPAESVDNSSVQITNLVSTMLSQQDYDSFKDWVAFCSGTNNYYLAYNINGQYAKILHFYGVNNGSNIDWSFEVFSDDSFSFTPNAYTFLGSVSGALGSSDVVNNNYDFVNNISIVLLVVAVLFFVFRIRKRQRNSISL